MNWYTTIKFNCRHTTYLIEKKLYGRLGPRGFAQLYIHLLTCPFCRLYKKQTRVIKRFLRKLLKEKEPAALDAAFKERLQKIIEDKIKP